MAKERNMSQVCIARHVVISFLLEGICLMFSRRICELACIPEGTTRRTRHLELSSHPETKPRQVWLSLLDSAFACPCPPAWIFVVANKLGENVITSATWTWASWALWHSFRAKIYFQTGMLRWIWNPVQGILDSLTTLGQVKKTKKYQNPNRLQYQDRTLGSGKTVTKPKKSQNLIVPETVIPCIWKVSWPSPELSPSWPLDDAYAWAACAYFTHAVSVSISKWKEEEAQRLMNETRWLL